MIDGPTEVSLQAMGVASVEDLFALPTAEICRRLATAPFPASEKLIGALMLKAVADLREATADVARSSRQIKTGTASLIKAAWLTLGVAFAALIVSVLALLHAV
jgi:hypothetical protein